VPSAPGAPARTGAAVAARPNIIVILTDDQESSSLQYMPNTLSLLVAKGASFNHFFLNDPICCPSRSTIFLGEYRQNHRLETDPDGCGFRFFADGNHRRALGKLFKDAGYRTSYLGKFLNSHDAYLERVDAAGGDDHLLLGWDDYHLVIKRGFYGFSLHENGRIREVPAEGGEYQTDLLSRLAVQFITGSVAEQSPFLVFIAPEAPHEPATPALRHRETFPDAQAPRIPSFNQANVSSQPSLRASPPLTPEDVVAIDERYRRQLQSLQAVDEMVRDLVQQLEVLGQLDHTFIFYLSDNGMHYGDHRLLRGKGTPFEASVRVPLIIRGPGVEPNRVITYLASNADILPTLLEIAGVPPSKQVDGRSLSPFFRGELRGIPWRNALALESRHENRNQGVPRFGAIRTWRYNWIEYEDGSRELYDLILDPHETANVDVPANAGIASGLSGWLHDLLGCSGVGCRQIEDEPLATRLGGR
jgi:arylsulfatase A-like enzyme